MLNVYHKISEPILDLVYEINESMKVFENLKTEYRLLYREYELFSE